jgi:hypothetical protein
VEAKRSIEDAGHTGFGEAAGRSKNRLDDVGGASELLIDCGDHYLAEVMENSWRHWGSMLCCGVFGNALVDAYLRPAEGGRRSSAGHSIRPVPKAVA